MAKTAPIAKVCAPRLFGVVPRNRLFQRLDQNRGRPLIWLDSPPGSGKTTLVASYLEQRAIPSLWYQVDGADADPAVLFHYLSVAAAAHMPRAAQVLPRFLPEHTADLGAFAKLYFRALFERLPTGTVIVFDNHQEAAGEPALQAVVFAATEAVPPDSTVFVVSRADAPPDFATLAGRGALFALHWDSLRLTLEETREIARGCDVADDWLVQALHHQSEGWAAGITLMLERLDQGPHDSGMLPSESRESVFNYFAALLFDRLAESQQAALISLSFMPYVTVDLAQLVCDEEKIESLLEQLHRRRMFVDRRPGTGKAYVFHALFRDFLRARAVDHWGALEASRRMLHCAEVLSSLGDVSAAIEVLAALGLADEAGRLILAHAKSILMSGRRQTLERWISILPGEILRQRPMLLYWLGAARAQTEPERGIDTVKEALLVFDQLADEKGQLRCLMALLRMGYVGHAALSQMNVWLDRLLAALGEDPERSCGDVSQLEVWSVLCSALLFVRPWHPWTELAAIRTESLLGDCEDAGKVVAAAMSAMELMYTTGNFERAERFVDILLPLLLSDTLSPAEVYWAHIQIGYVRFYQARYDEALSCINRAVDLARALGLPILLQRALLTRYMLEFRVFDRVSAANTLAEAEALATTNTLSEKGFLLIFQARRAWIGGNHALAADMAQQSYDEVRRGGSPHLHCIWAGFTAEILAGAGRIEHALEALTEGQVVVDRTPIYRWWRAYFKIAESFIQECKGDREEALATLREGLHLAACDNLKYAMRFLEIAMPRMFSLALENDIEVDFVRHLITLFRLRAPSEADDQWPRPVGIRTLSKFEVVVNDQLLTFPRKTPKKTLSLLKALIAHGARDVPEQWLCDALWGDEEADAAREALGITVLRLRKLLGTSDAILQQGGRVSLNRALVWVDAWRFESRSAQGDIKGIHQALELYRGSFLPDDEGEPWTVSARERLRGKFIHLLASHGAALEATGECQAALDGYFRGIDADPIVEAFHQGLMRCYQREGRHTEAISAYRRLRQTLSAVLGVAPGAESRMLYERSMGACGEPIGGEPAVPVSILAAQRVKRGLRNR